MSGVRAPRENGALLCVPDFQDLPGLVERNQLALGRLSQPWADLRVKARSEVLSLLGLGPDHLSLPWVAAGHQPEMCHPGVWAKYFATKGLGNAIGGWSFNLVADGDLCRQIWLPFPEPGHDGLLSRAALRVGAGLGGRPWERVETTGFELDWKSVWKSLQEGFGIDPVGRKYLVPPVDSHSVQKAGSLSQFNTNLRQKAQLDLGLDLPDVFQSLLVQTKSFHQFLWRILRDISRFAHVHNEALRGYRLKNGISNPGQPMANLESEGDWHEAPFWILEKKAFSRRPLWISQQSGVFHLGGRPGEVLIKLDPGSPEKGLDLLTDHGLGIWPRALTNTLFLRWLVADVFVHGLGGAIYDQVTDEVAREWIGGEPPGYALVTATLRLPLGRVACEEEKDLRRQLRRAWWNPDQLPGASGNDVSQMREWVGLRRPGGLQGAGKRIRARHLLWKIHVEAADRYRQLDEGVRQSVLARGSNRLAMSREWPWILYPGHSLKELLAPLLEGAKYKSNQA